MRLVFVTRRHGAGSKMECVELCDFWFLLSIHLSLANEKFRIFWYVQSRLVRLLLVLFKVEKSDSWK